MSNGKYYQFAGKQTIVFGPKTTSNDIKVIKPINTNEKMHIFHILLSIFKHISIYMNPFAALLCKKVSPFKGAGIELVESNKLFHIHRRTR